jgi:hypothetical protein
MFLLRDPAEQVKLGGSVDDAGEPQLRNFVRSRSVAVHYVLSLSIALIVIGVQIELALRNPDLAKMIPDLWKWVDVHRVYINIVSIARFAAEGHAVAFLIFVFASAPSVAAIIVSSVGFGPKGLATLLGRFKPWASEADRPRALLAYLLMLAVFLGGLALCLYLVVKEGKASDYGLALDNFGGSLLTFIPLAVLGAFLDEGGSLEELGWRGFVLPQLQAKLGSPLRATIVLAVIWWSWHLPRDIPGLIGGENLQQFAINQAIFFSLIVALAIVATCMVNMTGGSVLPAIFIHGGTNVWSKGVLTHGVHGVLTPALDVRTLIVYGLAVVVLCVAGPRLAWRPAAVD